MTTRRDIITGVPVAPFVRTAPASVPTSADAELLALRPLWLARNADFEAIMKMDEDHPDYEAEEDRTIAAETAVIEQIAEIRAKTIQGLRFKAEVSTKNSHLFLDLVYSIVDDIFAFEP